MGSVKELGKEEARGTDARRQRTKRVAEYRDQFLESSQRNGPTYIFWRGEGPYDMISL